jgi:hypothetical protein
MLDRLRALLQRRYAPALIWSAAITLAMAWPIVFPPVQARGVTVREDTTNFTMFDMAGENYAAILGAVAGGRLAVTEMQSGFRLFTRGSLPKQQLNRRIVTGRKVIDQYIATERTAARPALLAVWAGLALVLPGLWIGGRHVLLRRAQPLTAPPVRPEMM